MERLSASDAMFLELEEAAHPLQFGFLFVFRGESPGLDALRERLSARIGRCPRLRQTLVRVPLGLARPVLVDDPAFDIGRHVSRAVVPSPGDDRALRSLVGEFISVRLEMDRPMWEIRLVEGLQDGFAVAAKVHHSYADAGSFGAAVVELLADGAGEPASAAPWRPARRPAALTLLAQALVDYVRTPLELTRGHSPLTVLRSCVRGAVGAVRVMAQPNPAPMTRLNRGPAGPDRELHWLRTPSGELQQLATDLRATLNAVVLAVVAGAFRRYFERHGDPHEPIRVLMPISLRPPGTECELGNKTASIFPALPVGEPDPVARVRLVTEEISRLLIAGRATGVVALKTFGQIAPPQLTGRLVRTVYSRPDFNLLATTVELPDAPASLFGSELEEVVPCVHLPVWHGVGIGVTAYGDTATLAVTTDRARIGDGAALRDDLAAALDEMRSAVRPAERREGAIAS